MLRSAINALILDAWRFFEDHHFALPPFAHWSLDEWETKGAECGDIYRQQLGWDVTDFGSGGFDREGLLLFTVRNGTLTDPNKTYCEKAMIVGDGQLTPTHFHWQKTEDILVRAGGTLCVQVWNRTEDDELADTPVALAQDGVRRSLAPGEILRLRAGESVTLTPGVYHQFWGEGRVLVGEVSRVNDDANDNRFHRPIGRFPEIEEDVPPVRLLVGDYARFAPGIVSASATI